MKPRNYQIEAVDAAANAFKSEQKATVVMCCGSGKTLVSRLIVERVHHNLVMVVAPTVMLLNQLKRLWDGLNELTIIVDHENPENREDLAGLLAHHSSVTVLTTYHSAPECVQAFDEAGKQVDIAVYDEAHKTAGSFAGKFSTTLDDSLPIRKRLFVTATPRHADYSGKTDKHFFTMDNPEQYGPIVYNYPLRRGIEDGTVTDYRVLVASVTDEEARESLSEPNDQTKMPAMALALSKAMHEFDLNKVITYHATIEESREFVGYLARYLPDVKVVHVSSEQTRDERLLAFNTYRNEHKAIITNARVLGEGIDVPATDAVMYCTPKTSVQDIVQTSGRAMRVSPGKDFGYVIIPALTKADLNSDEFGDFNPVIEVLGALAENDDLLKQIIKLRLENEWEFEQGLSKFVSFTSVGTGDFDYKKLLSSISLRMIKSMNASFFERLEQFIEYRDTFGTALVPTMNTGSLGIWVKHMRKQFSLGLLASEKVDILNREGFVWDVSESHFNEQLSQLKRYLEQGNSVEQASTGPFMGFIKNARARQRAGTLPERRKKALEQLGVYFDVDAYRYESMLRDLREAKSKGIPLTEGGFTDWIKYQRQKYKDGSLEQGIIDAFNEMGIPLERDFEQVFNDNVTRLASILQSGKRPEGKLRNFMKRHRTLHRQNKINEDRLKAIRKAEQAYGVRILGD
ncbi:Helicase associated domain-containing protein [Vreelandella subterranea]|uniref:Helicase associated domain-containing protein n=1 Tax=Vreelandella subterranea TaxID=416874 RepID=A0A1H9URT4_9GAMM|nr:DEAD/DEAH box helicase [Halomonas subterranea]SES12250.1 Helicase associated domain-containing protein [Halomonas subterranea]